MGRAVALRADYTAGEVRRLASPRRMERKRGGRWRSRRYLMEPRAPRRPRLAGWIGGRCGAGGSGSKSKERMVSSTFPRPCVAAKLDRTHRALPGRIREGEPA